MTGSNSITVYNLQPGSYYLFVESDGVGGVPGGITGTVTLNAPTLPPANDTCAAPEVLTWVPAPARNEAVQPVRPSTAIQSHLM